MIEIVSVAMRAPKASDSAQLLAWRNLPDIRKWMYTDHQIAQSEHDRWFAGMLAERSHQYWVVELDEKPVGVANLADLTESHGRASWAYYLAEPTARGRGVGAYVEYSIIEHAFGHLGLNKLWCEVLVENAAVVKLHETFGFKREALFRQHIRKQTQAFDVVGLGLLAEDWLLLRADSRGRLAARGLPV